MKLHAATKPGNHLVPRIFKRATVRRFGLVALSVLAPGLLTGVESPSIDVPRGALPKAALLVCGPPPGEETSLSDFEVQTVLAHFESLEAAAAVGKLGERHGIMVQDTSEQGVLRGYHGYWSRWRLQEFNVFHLMELEPERWPYIRNEIFARYGRSFRTPAYQDHFDARSWYKVRPNYNESWVPPRERAIAQTILSVERPAHTPEQLRSRVLEQIEYQGDQASLTFTGPQTVVWTDPGVAFTYGISGDRPHNLQWRAYGDWIVVLSRPRFEEGYYAVAYRLDHATGTIGMQHTDYLSEEEFQTAFAD